MFNLVKRNENKMTYCFNLAGFEQNEIEVRAGKRSLVVFAEKKDPRLLIDVNVSASADEQTVYFNLPRKVNYTVRTPFDFDPNALEINYDNGVLRIAFKPENAEYAVYRI